MVQAMTGIPARQCNSALCGGRRFPAAGDVVRVLDVIPLDRTVARSVDARKNIEAGAVERFAAAVQNRELTQIMARSCRFVDLAHTVNWLDLFERLLALGSWVTLAVFRGYAFRGQFSFWYVNSRPRAAS